MSRIVQGAGSKGRIAWSISPLLSGVTTAYQVVSEGLRRAGWEVVGVTSGADVPGGADPRCADEFFEVLLPGCADVRRVAAEFVRWASDRRIDVVFSSGNMFTLAAAPALPPQVRFVSRCPSITRHSYALAVAVLPRTAQVVVETPRQQQDLIRDWAVPPERCALIPGGVEVDKFNPGTLRDFRGGLRLIYLGRLDEASKGIMLLPVIATQLVESKIEFHLDIVGDGPDGNRLKESLRRANLRERVTLHGYLPRPEILPILQRAHLFVLPSRYEGHSWALLETMACGCVPIASRIAGGTDFVVTQGANGALCPVGKAGAFTREIVNLAADRNRLEAWSRAAREAIQGRFSLERVVRDHDALFTAVLAQAPPAFAPIPISQIQVPNMHGAGWRRFVPQPVKNYVRTWAERFGRTV
ncbi:MAG: glycosyltransferase family 4 protein [Terriglobia bacterium]|jgi:glycosyltransferase involved in cell wall biosynthesis